MKHARSHLPWSKRAALGELGFAVVASTDSIVEHALHGNWLMVLDLCEQRRGLLEKLEPACAGYTAAPAWHALNAAVCESEKAVSRIVAHAMICKQTGNQDVYASRCHAHV